MHTFTSTSSQEGEPGYPERSGQSVALVRPLTDRDVDYPGVGPMYRIRFADGVETDCFADELSPAPYRGPWATGDALTRLLERATQEHFDAGQRLAALLEQTVAEIARDYYKDGVALKVHGEAGIDSPSLDPECVFDSSGGVIASATIDGNQADIERWDEFTEVVSDFLNHLIDITGDDWYGTNEISLRGRDAADS